MQSDIVEKRGRSDIPNDESQAIDTKKDEKMKSLEALSRKRKLKAKATTKNLIMPTLLEGHQCLQKRPLKMLTENI